MSGKRAFLELLKQEGVEILFGNPGTTELPLMDALAVENELRYVLALQEASVIGMADGYAQASGKLAVVNLHVTPGLGNAMGMLYDAQKAGSPILVTAGQHDQDFNATEPILWADLPPIARPLVKWSAEVHRLADLPRLVHRAAKTALAPPSGPVFALRTASVMSGKVVFGSPRIATWAHERIAAVFVIFNNSSYRILKQRLVAQRGLAAQVDRFVGMELNDPAIDYVGLARSLGVAAERATSVHDATDLIAQGLKSDAPLLIDVPVDRNYRPV
jgi:thiamine pyrophosphate-dependent acetolactate synthase large subunit-like protein